MNIIKSVCLITMLLLPVCTTVLHAQWVDGGLFLNDTLQGLPCFEWPRVAPDNNGGAYIVWQDTFVRPRNVYLQRIDRDGFICWPHGGIRLSADDPGGISQIYPQIRSYKQYVFIVWERFPYLQAQKVDTAGNKLWGPAGVVVNTKLAGITHSIALDSCGGLFVAAYGDQPDSWYTPVWIQRLDSAGTRLWSDTGIVLTNRSLEGPRQWYQIRTICSPMPGRPYVTWIERSSPTAAMDRQTYMQKLDEEGNILWAPNGIPLSDTDSDSLWPRENLLLIEDGHGGTFTFWSHDYQFVQHVDSNGIRMLGPEGKSLFNGNTRDVLPDRNGGFIMNYLEEDPPNQTSYPMAQRFSPTVTELWNSGGVRIVRNPLLVRSERRECDMTSDGSGGCFIVLLSKGEGNVWSQWIDSTGRLRYGIEGYQITPRHDKPAKFHIEVENTAPGEAIVAWYDSRVWCGRIACSKLTRDGVVSIHSLTSPKEPGLSVGVLFPQPSNGSATIVGDAPEAGLLSFVLYDVLGRSIGIMYEASTEPGGFRIPITTSHLATGTYYLHAALGPHTNVVPLIVTAPQ